MYAGLPTELQHTIRRRAKVFNSLKNKYSTDSNLSIAIGLIEHLTSLMPEITGRSRKQKFVIYRMAFSFLCRAEFGLNTVKIGELLNRDHSSIVHFTKVFNNFLDTKDELALTTLHQVNIYLRDITTIKNDE